MPPAPSPSSFPEPPDPLALLDQAVGGLIAFAVPTPSLAAAAGGGFGPLPSIGGLPPIAGGSPGTLDQFSALWSLTKSTVADPIASLLDASLSTVARAALAAIAGLLSVMGWWIYKWTDAVLGSNTVSWRSRFPHPDIVKGLSPWYYVHKVMRMGLSWLRDQVRDYANWLAGRVTAWAKWGVDRVQEFFWWLRDKVITWAKWLRGRTSELVNWLAGRVTAWAKWLWSSVSGGLEWLAGRVVAWAKWGVDRVQEFFWWLRDKVITWAKWLWSSVSGGLDWVVGRVVTWAKWLWARVQDGLQWAWDNVISKIPEGIVAGAAEIGRLIREAFEWLVDMLFSGMVDWVRDRVGIIPKFWRGEYTSMDEIWDDIWSGLDTKGTHLDVSGLIPRVAGGAPIAPLLIPVALVGVFLVLPAVSITISSIMTEGVQPLRQQVAKLVGARIPPFAILRDGFLRGLLPEGVHDDWLGKQGFNAANIELQKALYEEIPGSGDLVRMGVREVFTPEIAERFGQFEDFPPAFGEWMAKQGFTDFWSRAFWGAHWDLPSVTQGFQMRHRDVINDEDLQLLLRALDVMPFWREKLTDIAFRVVTRVDVRRMYAEGVFERDQVKRVYLDLGYKPEDAEALTEFVVRRYPRKGTDEPSDLRSLTISSVKQAYARRLITGDDALERLMELDYSADDAALVISIWEFDWFQDPSLRSDVDPKGLARSTIEKAYERRLIDLNAGVLELGELGYTPEDARLLLQLVDLRLDEQLADLEIDGLVSDYQDGIISDAQLAAVLADLNIPQGRIDFLLQREILQRQAKRRRLTLSQMKKALAADLMEEAEYRARLAATGYNARDVDILVALNVEAV